MSSGEIWLEFIICPLFALTYLQLRSHESLPSSQSTERVTRFDETGMINYFRKSRESHTYSTVGLKSLSALRTDAPITSCSLTLKTHRLIICFHSLNSSLKHLLYEKANVTSGAIPGCYYSADFHKYDCFPFLRMCWGAALVQPVIPVTLSPIADSVILTMSVVRSVLLNGALLFHPTKPLNFLTSFSQSCLLAHCASGFNLPRFFSWSRLHSLNALRTFPPYFVIGGQTGDVEHIYIYIYIH